MGEVQWQLGRHVKFNDHISNLTFLAHHCSADIYYTYISTAVNRHEIANAIRSFAVASSCAIIIYSSFSVYNIYLQRAVYGCVGFSDEKIV